jgi:hypothetical protein
MCITVHPTLLPRDDRDAPLAFDRDAVGFEVREGTVTEVSRDG